MISSVAAIAKICCGGRLAVEALEQASVDRPRRVHRELLADDGAHERGVRSAARRPGLRHSALVEQPREHRVGGAQVLPGVYAWPSTAPGTPVFVEYLGWIFISGRMWCTACETADRGLRVAGRDELELAVEGRDVAACPHAVQRRLEQPVDADGALLDLEAPLLQRPERRLEPELQQDRVARDVDDAVGILGVEELHALDGAVAHDVAYLVGHVEVDAALGVGVHDLLDRRLVGGKPSRRCTSETRSAVSSRLTTQSQAPSPPPMMTTRLPANSLWSRRGRRAAALPGGHVVVGQLLGSKAPCPPATTTCASADRPCRYAGRRCRPPMRSTRLSSPGARGRRTLERLLAMQLDESLARILGWPGTSKIHFSDRS
jgi:hypothetical protein